MRKNRAFIGHRVALIAGLMLLGPGIVLWASIAVDPSNSQVLYVGTGSGEIFKSQNGGQSFYRVFERFGNLGITAITIDAQDPATVYAGTATCCLLRPHVLKTITGGERSWADMSLGLGDGGVGELVIDPYNSLIVYAATGEGVYKTVTEGGRWFRPSNGLPLFLGPLAIDPQDSQTLYVGTAEAGPYKTTDGGETWFRIIDGIRYEGFLQTDALAVDPKTPTTVYTSVSVGAGTVFKSTNGGGFWQRASDGLPGGPVPSLIIDPETTDTLYAGTRRGVFKSTDGAASWFPSGLSDLFFINSLAIDPQNPSTLYAQAGDRLFQSTDAGDTWFELIGFGAAAGRGNR